MTKPIHQSTAQVASNCLARYKAEIVDGIRTDNGFSQLGTIVHASIEEAYRASANGTSQVDAAIQALDESWAQRDKATTPVWVYAEAERMLRAAYHEESNLYLRIPRGTKMAVEQVWRMDADFNAVGEDGEVAYSGRMDAIMWSPKGVRISDWKTIQRMPGKDELATDIQARIYSLAALALFKHVDEVTFSLVLLRHQYEVSVTFKRGEAWERSTKAYLRAVSAAVAMAHDLDEWPATPGDGCQYCPIRFKCEALTSLIETGVVSAETEAEGAARLYLATKGIGAPAERAARVYAEDAPIAVGIRKRLGFKPGTTKAWTAPLVSILAQLRSDGATDEDLAEWFPGTSVSKKSLEFAATELLKRGEIECSPHEYVAMFQEERPKVTFTTYMEESDDE